MKKKQGFTLVELLAVIVILAVLVLLAVPSVLKMMDNAKANAFEIEAENIGKAAKSAYADDLLNNDLTRSTESGYCYSIEYLEAAGYVDKSFSSSYKGSVLIGDTNVIWYTNGKNSVTGSTLGGVEVDTTLQTETSGFDGCSGLIASYSVYKESILNGAYPRISTGMIAVTIGNDGTVTTVSPTSSSWYSYENKQWANVVLVKESGTETRTYYETNNGVTVAEADILAYLVWIPRYRYTLFNVDGTAATYSDDTTCTANCPQSISITFENAYTTKSTGSTNGTELTHPAFTYNGIELNGIWVGKFETTPLAGSTCATSPSEANCTDVSPTIKPNVASLRNQNVSTEFITSLKFGTDSIYGISAESRMSKNVDWGAVVYLSYSEYGINDEIRINNNSNYTTGCGASAANAAATSSCEIAYGSGVSSYPQSTTGNIYGIFDMSGGAWEYQMGVYTDASSNLYSGRCNIYHSGYKGIYGDPTYTGCDSGITSNTTGLDYPNSKYYKLYITTSWQSNTSNLGEALGETNYWYKDRNYFVSASYPWFLRGGYYFSGVGAGGFYLSGTGGGASGGMSWRGLVLTS